MWTTLFYQGISASILTDEKLQVDAGKECVVVNDVFTFHMFRNLLKIIRK